LLLLLLLLLLVLGSQGCSLNGLNTGILRSVAFIRTPVRISNSMCGKRPGRGATSGTGSWSCTAALLLLLLLTTVLLVPTLLLCCCSAASAYGFTCCAVFLVRVSCTAMYVELVRFPLSKNPASSAPGEGEPAAAVVLLAAFAAATAAAAAALAAAQGNSSTGLL
jgi:hypothetical protein